MSNTKRKAVPKSEFEGLDLLADEAGSLLASAFDRTRAAALELAAFCTACGDYVKASQMLKKEGEVLTSSNGFSYQNPWMAIKKRSMDHIIKFHKE